MVHPHYVCEHRLPGLRELILAHAGVSCLSLNLCTVLCESEDVLLFLLLCWYIVELWREKEMMKGPVERREMKE